MSGVYRSANATVSAHDAKAVTPSDSTVLPCTRALWVGTGGTVNVVTGDGTTVAFTNVASGMILPIQVTQVLATSTTASAILALY